MGEKAETARTKLMELGESAADVREGAALMAGLEACSRILKTRIEKEREAYSIDAAPPPDDPGKLAANMTPNEIARRIAFVLAQGLHARDGPTPTP